MRKRFKLNQSKRQVLEGITFILPFIFGTLMFFMFPLYVSIKLSFGKLVKLQGFVIEWLGLNNYLRAFIFDTSFIPMLLQTIKKTLIQVPLIIVFSVMLSILVNKNIRLKGFFRTVFFLPFLLGTGDVMNQILGLGLDEQIFAFAGSNLLPKELLLYLGPRIVIAIENFFSIIVVILWNSGVQILLLLSGLQSIPNSLYESANVDGATEWEMFWKITFPMLSPIMLLTTIYTIIASFTDISNPVLDYIRKNAFISSRFEYAAAMGWIYFLFIIALVSAVFMAFRNYIYSTFESRGIKKDGRKDLY